eukprot:GHVU01114393.1.p1 GENE.GHVU01114393.1~~GHVU01114393.1.p1  ORF type:complete len:1362 (+),score=144.17 GHVU01114393.1:986-5071(+)
MPMEGARTRAANQAEEMASISGEHVRVVAKAGILLLVLLLAVATGRGLSPVRGWGVPGTARMAEAQGSACDAVTKAITLKGRRARRLRRRAATARNVGTTHGSANRRQQGYRPWRYQAAGPLAGVAWLLLCVSSMLLRPLRALLRCSRGLHSEAPPRLLAFVARHGQPVRVDATGSRRLIADTGCSQHLGPRGMFSGGILHERPLKQTYAMARPQTSFETEAEAAVGIECLDILGKWFPLVLRVSLGPDDLPPLIKPTFAHLVSEPQQSWIQVRDYYGALRTIRVDDPQGAATHSLPSFSWRLAHKTVFSSCFTVQYAMKAACTTTTRDLHARLLHPCPDRLAGTMTEQGLSTSTTHIRSVLGKCDTCAQKNAVNRSVPRSAGRRRRGDSFNDTVWWDLGHVRERGYCGEHTFSLLVDETTLWWDASPLKAKSDAPDHLLKWLYDHGAMEGLRSDNAGELKGTRVQVICRDHNVFMVTTPPYQSAANGIVERAIRELRAYLRVALHELVLPLSLWPALLPGICALHNVTYSPTLASSPWLLRYGSPPSLSLLLGDTVIVRPPGDKTSPKTLQLPGRPMLYLGTLNSSTAFLYDVAARSKTVYKVHPSQLGSVTPRVAPSCSSSVPLGSSQAAPPTSLPSAPGPATDLPITSGRPQSAGPSDPMITFFRRESSSSGSSHASDLPLEEEPDPPVGFSESLALLDQDSEYLPPAVSPVVPPLAVESVDAGHPPHRYSTRGAVSHSGSPRRGGKLGVIAQQWGQQLAPGLITSRARGSYQVSWLRSVGHPHWEESHLDNVPDSAVVLHFNFNDDGSLPDAALSALSPETSSPSTHYCVASTPIASSGGAFYAPGTHASWPPPQYDKAVQDEFVAVLRNQVLGEVVPYSSTAMRMCWRFTEKGRDHDGTPTYKARWYCRGDMDQSPYETYAGTPARATFLIFLIFLLTKGWDLWLLDAKNAFLQASLPSDIHASIILDSKIPRLPSLSPYPDIPQCEWDRLLTYATTLRPGQCRRLRRALYGDRRSPYLWHQQFSAALEKLGYEEVTESMYSQRGPASTPTAIMACHVDDCAMGGEEVEKQLGQLTGAVVFKKPRRVEESQPTTFLGMTLLKEGDSIVLSHEGYLSSLPLDGVSTKKVTEKQLREPAPEEIDESLVQEYRTWNGRLGWVVNTAPYMAVYFALFSKYCTTPCRRLLNAIICVLAALRARPQKVVLRRVSGDVGLVGYSDASFKNSDLTSRVGYKIFVRGANDTESDDNIIAWSTRKVTEKIDSSTSAELLGLKLLVKDIWEYVPVIKELWGKKGTIRIFIDNKPLFHQLKGSSCRSEPSMNKHLLYVKQELRKLNASVHWVPREEQRADSMTKPVWL